jgi:hypothetical protein
MDTLLNAARLMVYYGANAFGYEYTPQKHCGDARFVLYGGGTHEVLRDFIGGTII